MFERRSPARQQVEHDAAEPPGGEPDATRARPGRASGRGLFDYGRRRSHRRRPASRQPDGHHSNQTAAHHHQSNTPPSGGPAHPSHAQRPRPADAVFSARRGRPPSGPISFLSPRRMPAFSGPEVHRLAFLFLDHRGTVSMFGWGRRSGPVRAGARVTLRSCRRPSR